MSSHLEETLMSHLERRDVIEVAGAGSLRTVRARAKRRSLRTRIGVGICALVAIAGAAALVPRADDPNALVTAADPAPSAVATPVPAALPSDRVQPERLPDLGGEQVRNPLHDQIIGDGFGGFVAFLPQTMDQVLAGVVTIVRSDDGENWFGSHDWQLPEGHRMGPVRHVDGHFVAIIENSRRSFPGGAPMIDPRLALSTDLVNWRWVDLNLNPAGVLTSSLNPRHTIGAIAVNGDDVMVSVLSAPRNLNGSGFTSGQIESAEHGPSCGGSWYETGPSVLLWCDGEVEMAPPSGARFGLGFDPPERRLLLSEAGADAVVIDTFQPQHHAALNTWAGVGMHILFPNDDNFAVYNVRDAGITPTPREWDAAELVAVARRSNQERLLLLQLDGRYGTPLVGAEPSVAEFPAEVKAGTPFGRLEKFAVGPAGWAALVGDQSALVDLVQQDGWVVTGSLISGNVVIEAEDGSERHLFNQTRSRDLAPGVERGLFGEMRFHRPGSGEILIELKAEQIEAAHVEHGTQRRPAITALPSATFNRSTVFDGWTLSGDAVRGPLVLTSPTGIAKEFSDGFAFDNGDTSDGVETDFDRSAIVAISSTFSLETVTAPIRFYDDAGNVLVEFSGQQVFEDMVEAEYEFTSSPGSSTSWVVFSPDGIEWEVLWSMTSSGGRIATKVIVGDDEVLIDTGPKMERIDLTG